MYNILIICDAFALAIAAVRFGRLEMDPNFHHAIATCRQFPMKVGYRLLAPTQAIAQGSPLTKIQYLFDPAQTLAVPPGKTRAVIEGYGHPLLGAITPIFVNFFEGNRLWIKATFGGDPNAWPSLFNFARALRNFISHHAGHVHFENPNAPAVAWHHLTYSPADDGKYALGDFDIGDLMVLMFEFGDELDRLGCPFSR